MSDPILLLTSAQSDVELVRGQTREQALTVFAADGTTPVDIDGAEIIISVKDDFDGSLLLRASTNDGRVVLTTPASGVYTYTLDDFLTDGWDPGTYRYDIVIRNIPNSGDTYYHVRNAKFKVTGSQFTASGATIARGASVDFNAALIGTGRNELDGDKIDIDFTPSNYIPDFSPPEADDFDDLAAHLKGIDTAIGDVTSAGGEANTGENLGGGEGVFLSKAGTTLRFKSLIGGANVTLTSSSSEVTVDVDSVSGPAGSINNGVATYNGTGGDFLKLSPVAIDDSGNMSGVGNLTLSGTVDGRDVATDGTKLDGIEASADVTDATNVAAAGAVMADGTGDDITGDLVFTEKADHSSTPAAGKGYVWTKNTTPSTLIFTDDAGTDHDLTSGGGGSTITLFQALKSGTQATSASHAPLTGWAAAAVDTGSSYTWNTTTGQLTLDEAGTYSVSAWALGRITVSDRAEVQIQLQADTGSGFSDVAGAYDRQYAVRQTAQDDGSAQFHGFLYVASAGDILRLTVAANSVNPLNINTDSARISVMKVA